MLADGVVEDEERKFLEYLQGTITIDDATAIKIVEVAAIKNGGWLGAGRDLRRDQFQCLAKN